MRGHAVATGDGGFLSGYPRSPLDGLLLSFSEACGYRVFAIAVEPVTARFLG